MEQSTSAAAKAISSERVEFTLSVAHKCESISNITLGQSLKPYVEQNFQGWEQERLFPLAHEIKIQAYAALKAEYCEAMIVLFNTVPLDESVREQILTLHTTTIEKLSPVIVEKVVGEYLTYLETPSTKVYTESI